VRHFAAPAAFRFGIRSYALGAEADIGSHEIFKNIASTPGFGAARVAGQSRQGPGFQTSLVNQITLDWSLPDAGGVRGGISS
jgi:hypothetical protein